MPSLSHTCAAKCKNNYNFFEWKKKLGCKAVVADDEYEINEEYYTETKLKENSIADMQMTSRAIG